MATMTAQGLIWVCEDCLFSHVYGERRPEYEDREPWALWAEEPMGSLAMGGACDWETCEERNVRGECDCDVRTFSGSPCDGCGSWLAGARHAFTYFTRED